MLESQKLIVDLVAGDRGYISADAVYTSTPVPNLLGKGTTSFFLFPDKLCYQKSSETAQLSVRRTPYGYQVEPPFDFDPKSYPKPGYHADSLCLITNNDTWIEAVFRKDK